MNQLYKNYTSCCRGKHTSKINPNSTDDEIRRYMLGEHNKFTLNMFDGSPTSGLAVPYKTEDKSQILTPNYLKKLKEIFDIILPSQLEEYVIFHNNLPADTMSKSQLNLHLPKKYENSNIRQPVA